MSGAGIPLLSLTKDEKAVAPSKPDNAAASAAASGSSAPASGAAPPVQELFKFAHQGSVFTLHTSASNAEFTVSHLLSSSAQPTASQGAVVARNDALIGYRSYYNDNLVLVWSSAETDLMTVGGEAADNIRVRIDRLHDACVVGAGLPALLSSRADIAKKQLKVCVSFATWSVGVNPLTHA